MVMVNRLLGAVFGIVICLIIAGFALYLAYGDYVVSKDWKITEGKVISSQLTKHRNSDNDGWMYRPDITYQYTYDNNEYQGNCCGKSSSDQSSEMKFVESHSNGSIISIYVDPQQPFGSRIKEDVNPFETGKILVIGFGGFCLVVCIWSFIMSIVKSD